MLWVLKRTSHRDGSFEYPQHMFWLRIKKIYIFVTHSLTKVLIQHEFSEICGAEMLFMDMLRHDVQQPLP